MPVTVDDVSRHLAQSPFASWNRILGALALRGVNRLGRGVTASLIALIPAAIAGAAWHFLISADPVVDEGGAISTVVAGAVTFGFVLVAVIRTIPRAARAHGRHQGDHAQ